MKTLHLIFLLAALAATPCAGFGQNQTKLARIHLYTIARGLASGTKIQPYPENSETVSVPNNRYVLIESELDSLAFVSGKKAMYLQLERGKNYYLIISYPNSADDGFFRIRRVNETTEWEFKWTLLVNDQSIVPHKTYKF